MRYNSFDFCDCRLIKQHGRCGFEDGALAMSWSNSGIEFNFEGTGFIVSFRHYAGETPAYVRVFVDGVSQRFAIANGEERICYDELAEGRHNVKILRITEGLKLLPDKQRQILVMRELGGMSYAEIGAALSLEEGTVKSRIFRARKRLSAYIIKRGNIPDELESKEMKGGGKT